MEQTIQTGPTAIVQVIASKRAEEGGGRKIRMFHKGKIRADLAYYCCTSVLVHRAGRASRRRGWRQDWAVGSFASPEFVPLVWLVSIEKVLFPPVMVRKLRGGRGWRAIQGQASRSFAAFPCRGRSDREGRSPSLLLAFTTMQASTCLYANEKATRSYGS